MTDSNEIKIFISSPPDREFLVAEIFVGQEQLAEINRENEREEIEFYPKKSGEVWKIDCENFINALQEAKQKLSSRYS